MTKQENKERADIKRRREEQEKIARAHREVFLDCGEYMCEIL